MSDHATLEPIDAAEVTILVDNSVDILLTNERMAQRAPLHHDWSERDQLIAEHGYALLLTIHSNGHTESLLYDAGLGRHTAIHNMDVLGLNPRELRTVVLSHGHADHHGGLFEPIIPRTISELAAIGPQVIVPGHCTGWKATHKLSRQLPDAYLQTSVGARLRFGSL